MESLIVRLATDSSGFHLHCTIVTYSADVCNKEDVCENEDAQCSKGKLSFTRQGLSHDAFQPWHISNTYDSVVVDTDDSVAGRQTSLIQKQHHYP